MLNDVNPNDLSIRFPSHLLHLHPLVSLQTCLQIPICLSLSLHSRHLLYPLFAVLKPGAVVFMLGTNTPSLPDASNSSGRQIEDREDSSSAPASGSRHHTRGGPGLATIGMGLTGFLLTVALITTFYPGGGKKNNPTPPNRPTQPTGPPSTNNTQPTSPPQPNNPPRTFVGREERDLDHGLPRDTSGEPYPNLHLDNIADGVLTTAGPSEVSSTNNEDG